MPEPEPPWFLVTVTSKTWHRPAFCCGTVWRGPWCVEAAPIVHWALGMRWERFQRYCGTKGWSLRVQEVPPKPTPKS